mgnify:CR=1 FL=1
MHQIDIVKGLDEIVTHAMDDMEPNEMSAQEIEETSNLILQTADPAIVAEVESVIEAAKSSSRHSESIHSRPSGYTPKNSNK